MTRICIVCGAEGSPDNFICRNCGRAAVRDTTNKRKGYRKPVQWFTVDRICANCGERHRHASQVQIAYGPSEEKTVAEAYSQGLPPVVRELLRDEVWCEWCRDYWVQGDGQKVFVGPFGG